MAPISLEASGEDCCFGSDYCNDVAAMKSDFYHIPQEYLRVPQISSGSLSYLPHKKTIENISNAA